MIGDSGAPRPPAKCSRAVPSGKTVHRWRGAARKILRRHLQRTNDSVELSPNQELDLDVINESGCLDGYMGQPCGPRWTTATGPRRATPCWAWGSRCFCSRSLWPRLSTRSTATASTGLVFGSLLVLCTGVFVTYYGVQSYCQRSRATFFLPVHPALSLANLSLQGSASPVLRSATVRGLMTSWALREMGEQPTFDSLGSAMSTTTWRLSSSTPACWR